MICGQEVRLLRALGDAESMSVAGAVEPSHALSTASRTHAVSEGTLAKVWLTKLIHCSRARVLMTSMIQADADVDEEIR